MLPARFAGSVFFLATVAVFAAATQETAPDQAERSSPFSVGERLVYRIQWDPPWYIFFLPAMDAGEAELQLNSDREHNGRKVLEVRLKGRSSGTLAKMVGMQIEDEFSFLTEPDTFCTLTSSSRIREGKRKRQVDVQYLGESGKLHIRVVDEAPIPPKIRRDETVGNIPECVHDPFSAIFLFRKSPIQEGYTQTFLLANDDKIREVKAVVDRREMIQGPSGKIAAWRVTPAALMGNLFKEGGQFRIWFSADERKIPLQFEVKVGIGRIFGKLKATR